MTKQEISEEMKALLVAIDALLEQHGLEIEDFPQFAAIYRAAERRVAQVQNLKRAAKVVPARYLNGGPDDISKPDFGEIVMKWREQVILKGFNSYKKLFADVEIDIEKFAKSIGETTSTYPINKALYKEWAAAVRKAKSPTGAAVFQALIENKGAAWEMTADEEALNKHYNQNKAIYKKSETATFESSILVQMGLFEMAIDASTSPTDKNLPENQKKIKELYQETLDTWHMAEHMGFAGVASDSPDVLISCSCLEPNSSEVTYKVIPESTKIELLSDIKAYFKKQIKDGDTAPWHDAASYGITVMGMFRNKHSEDWKDYTLEEVKNLRFPTNIARWMWDCNTNAKNNKTDITSELKLIFEKLLDLALSFTKNYGPSFEFNVDELILEMKNIFKVSNKINIDDLIDLESIYKNVDNRIITTQEFYNKLKVAIDKSITDNSINNYYTTVINQNISETTNFEFIYKQLIKIESELIDKLTVLIENKKKEGKKPIPGRKYVATLRSIDVRLSSTINWSSNFKLTLIAQDMGTYYSVYVREIDLYGFNATKLDSSSSDFESIKRFAVAKDGKEKSQQVKLALTCKVTQALVAVNLSTEAVKQTIIRNLISAKLEVPFAKVESEVEDSIITKDPTYINGTMQTPTPITLTNYYTFDLNMSFNPNKNELEIYGSNAKLCDLKGKYTERKTIAPGEKISFEKDTTTIKLK